MEVSLTQFLTALGSGGFATLLTVGTNFYLGLRKAKQDEGNQHSTTTSAEWTKTSEEWSKLVTRLSEQTSVMQTQIATLIKENNRWQVDNEYLRGELRIKDNIIRQLRGGMPGTLNEALVISDDKGLITQINSAAALLFHYSEEDLIGRPTTVLVPERYREKHTDGMRRVNETGKAPDSTKTMQVYGLTREGEEVPINIQLTGWQSGGHWFYGAAIRRRTERLLPQASVVPDSAPEPEHTQAAVANVEDKARQQ